MSDPIVIAHHLMWTMYGWWLPNDPRGSTSADVYTPRLAELATHHYGRKQIQPASRDVRTFYDQARACLQFPLLKCDDRERSSIASAFADTIAAYRTPVTHVSSCPITPTSSSASTNTMPRR